MVVGKSPRKNDIYGVHISGDCVIQRQHIISYIIMVLYIYFVFGVKSYDHTTVHVFIESI